MSWHPNDICSDEDLQAYEASILSHFGSADWQKRRTKALEDWLFPILRGRGFDPYTLRTRFEPDAVQAYTASAYTDRVAAAQSTNDDDVDLAAVFATPGTDALYIGSSQPFRGVFFRLLESVSTVAGVMTVAYWAGLWQSIDVTDRTRLSSKTLGSGGGVTWTLPVDWASRSVNSAGPYYWVKVTLNAAPTGAKASQIGVIRASALRAPVTFRTLQLIFQEAPTGSDGPWRDKAEFYKGEADQALQLALPIIGGEFDTDDSDLVSATEAEQTSETAGGGPFTLERG